MCVYHLSKTLKKLKCQCVNTWSQHTCLGNLWPGRCLMPTHEAILKIQKLCLAEEVPIPAEAAEWSEAALTKYLENAAAPLPQPSAAASALPPPPPPPPSSEGVNGERGYAEAGCAEAGCGAGEGAEEPAPRRDHHRVRWAIDMAAWEPSPAEWSLLLSTVPQVTPRACNE